MIALDRCTTLAEFEAAHVLLAEMGGWDAAEANAYGVAEADTLAAYYGEQPAELQAAFIGTGAAFYLARWGGEPAGCAGFVRWGNDIAELKKLYVRPAFRGKGLARALMEAVLSAMRAAGYGESRLVTTRFMPEAVALYREFGFHDCGPFEPLPDAFAPFTLFMERRL
jgi:GNAT superfamily N-acetyltransferase